MSGSLKLPKLCVSPDHASPEIRGGKNFGKDASEDISNFEMLKFREISNFEISLKV